MTGEMNRKMMLHDDEWAFWRDVADCLPGAYLTPFDVYQGPVICWWGHRFFLADNGGGSYVYNETTDKVLPDFADDPHETARTIAYMRSGFGDYVERAA